jgi:serine/threonine protein kinase
LDSVSDEIIAFASPKVIDLLVFCPQDDIYSFGCFLLELFTGKAPWYGKTESQIRICLKNGAKLPPEFNLVQDQNLQSLIVDCWNGNIHCMRDVQKRLILYVYRL